MKIKEIMTKSIATVNKEDNVQHAAQLMKNFNVGSIPVCDGEKVIGIITDRDITLRSFSNGTNVAKQCVRDVMTSNPVLGNPEMDVSEASRIMSERQIRRLPVVENDNLIGIVSLGDIAVDNATKSEAEYALSDISEPCTPNIE